jgi:hypothetical protein
VVAIDLYGAEVPLSGTQCCVVFGGAEGDRTPDLRIANATLSQLSYGPGAAAGLCCR